MKYADNLTRLLNIVHKNKDKELICHLASYKTGNYSKPGNIAHQHTCLVAVLEKYVFVTLLEGNVKRDMNSDRLTP